MNFYIVFITLRHVASCVELEAFNTRCIHDTGHFPKLPSDGICLQNTSILLKEQCVVFKYCHEFNTPIVSHNKYCAAMKLLFLFLFLVILGNCVSIPFSTRHLESAIITKVSIKFLKYGSSVSRTS